MPGFFFFGKEAFRKIILTSGVAASWVQVEGGDAGVAWSVRVSQTWQWLADSVAERVCVWGEG